MRLHPIVSGASAGAALLAAASIAAAPVQTDHVGVELVSRDDRARARPQRDARVAVRARAALAYVLDQSGRFRAGDEAVVAVAGGLSRRRNPLAGATALRCRWTVQLRLQRRCVAARAARRAGQCQARLRPCSWRSRRAGSCAARSAYRARPCSRSTCRSPPRQRSDPRWQPAFAAARAAQPQPGPWTGAAHERGDRIEVTLSGSGRPAIGPGARCVRRAAPGRRLRAAANQPRRERADRVVRKERVLHQRAGCTRSAAASPACRRISARGAHTRRSTLPNPNPEGVRHESLLDCHRVASRLRHFRAGLGQGRGRRTGARLQPDRQQRQDADAVAVQGQDRRARMEQSGLPVRAASTTAAATCRSSRPTRPRPAWSG